MTKSQKIINLKNDIVLFENYDFSKLEIVKSKKGNFYFKNTFSGIVKKTVDDLFNSAKNKIDWSLEITKKELVILETKKVNVVSFIKKNLKQLEIDFKTNFSKRGDTQYLLIGDSLKKERKNQNGNYLIESSEIEIRISNHKKLENLNPFEKLGTKISKLSYENFEILTSSKIVSEKDALNIWKLLFDDLKNNVDFFKK